jgi:hypothetical protein
MNFRQKVEENVIIFLLSMLVVGFGAGFGAYRAIIEASNETMIPKTRKDELETSALSQLNFRIN